MVVTDNAAEQGPSAEGPYVVGHIGGAAKAKVLAFHIDDGDGSFGGYTPHRTDEIPVHHDVADDQNSRSFKGF